MVPAVVVLAFLEVLAPRAVQVAVAEATVDQAVELGLGIFMEVDKDVPAAAAAAAEEVATVSRVMPVMPAAAVSRVMPVLRVASD